MADYDKLTIKIVANTSSAIDTISRLSSRLDDLEKQAERMDLGRLHEIKGILEDISNIDFNKVSSSLYSVVKSLEGLYAGTGAKAIKEVLPTQEIGQLAETTSQSVEKTADRINISNLKIRDSIMGFLNQVESTPSNIKASLTDFSNFMENRLVRDFEQWREQAISVNVDLSNTASTLDKVKMSLEQTNNADSSFEKLGKEMSNIGLNGTQMESVLKTIGKEINSFTPKQIAQIGKAMKNLGFSTEQVKQTMSSLKSTTDKTTKAAKNGLQKVALKMKSLALYRVIRVALMKIQEAFSNAIQELAKFDSGFNQSISEIKSTFEYLARSILAMLSPLIQLVAPLIKSIGTELGKIANQIGQAFSGDTFTQAEESAEDYAESLKKVKSLTLGIDELNVADQEEDKQLFSETDGGQATILSETFGKIMEFVGTINKSLSGFVSNVLPAIVTLLTPILEIVNMVVDLINILVENTNESVNASLVSFVNMIGSIFKFIAELVRALMPTLVAIINIISPIINIINKVIGSIFDFVGGIFDFLSPILEFVNFLSVPLGAILQVVSTIFYVIEAIVKTVIDLFTFNWGNIGNDWVEMSEKVQKSWEDWSNSINQEEYRTDAVATNVSTPTTPSVDVPETSSSASGGSSLGSGRASSQNPTINIYLDSEEISYYVQKNQNNRGANLYKGGTLTYGK